MGVNRYNVDISDGENTVYTFTWADDPAAAYDRVNRELADQPVIWAGWTATVDPQPAASR